MKLTPLILLFVGTAWPLRAQNTDAEVLFVRRISPLFHERCLACHGNDEAKIKGGLDMRTPAATLKGGDSKKSGFIAGKAEDIKPIVLVSGTEASIDPTAVPERTAHNPDADKTGTSAITKSTA